MSETRAEYEARRFPPANRFMTTFTARNLLVSGKWVSSKQRRFWLARDAEQARQAMLRELTDPHYWKPGSHEWSDLQVAHVPTADVCCGRFIGPGDLLHPRTVLPVELCTAYAELYPGEGGVTADTVQTFANWLERYHKSPSSAITTQNWCGKVTKALFKALGLKQPRTKKEMLVALQCES